MNSNLNTHHTILTPTQPHRKLNQTLPVKEIDIDVQRPIIQSTNMMKRSELSTINDQSFVKSSSPVRLDENNNEMPSKQEKNEFTLITANINITTRLNNTNHSNHSTPSKPFDLFNSKQTPVTSSAKSVASNQTTHDKLTLQHSQDGRVHRLYGVNDVNMEVQRLAISNSQVKRAHFIESPSTNRKNESNVAKASTSPPDSMTKFLNSIRGQYKNTSKNEEFPPESESIYITPDTSPSNILDESKSKEEKPSPTVKDPKLPRSILSSRVDKTNSHESSSDQYLYLYMSSEKYAKIFERRFIELDRLIHNGKLVGAILLTSLPPNKTDLELLSELYGTNVVLDRRSVQCYIKLRKEILESFKSSLIRVSENKYLFMKNICFTTSFPKHEFRANYQV